MNGCVNTHTHTGMQAREMEYYSAIKKSEILPFAATWMDLEAIILSEVSQTQKEILYVSCFDLYVESLGLPMLLQMA